MSSNLHAGALGTSKSLPKSKAKTKQKRVIKVSSQLRKSILLLAVIFLMLSGASVYFTNIINNLDTEIRTLEANLDKVNKINDALQTEIMQGHNQSEIQIYATEKLGMILPEQSSIEYFAYSTKVGENANTKKVIKALISDLIQGK